MAGTLEIAVDMYAGRPDPELDLSTAQLAELRRRLSAAQEAPVHEGRDVPQLGYRGFLIYNPKQEEGLPFKVRIFGGTVHVTETAPTNERQPPVPRLYRDVGDIEGWLLQRALEQNLADDIAAMGGPKIARPDR